MTRPDRPGSDRPGSDRPGPDGPARARDRGVDPDRARAEAARRRRLAEVFGDVLPETTGDERDDAGDASAGQDRDGWYRDQVPPHHG